MIRVAACLLLGGCTVVEHVQVMPTFDKQQEIGCCVIYAEPNPQTTLSVTVQKAADESLKVKLGAKWRF
jgi:hypothetical protein